MSLLEAHHLVKTYDGRIRAVDDVSFDVHEGEIVGFLGPNGAGKTTTMMMIAGLLEPDGGQVAIQGRTLADGGLAMRHQLGVVPQDLAIYYELSARENLQFFGRVYGLSGDRLHRRIAEVLDMIRLNGSREMTVAKFSGGMKRRLNLGVALLHEPKLLILDEPTVGVDPQSRAHLLECIRDLKRSGTGVIYASHYMEEVQAVCDRIAVIDHGRIIAADTLANLLERVEGRVELLVSGWSSGVAGEFDHVVDVFDLGGAEARLMVKSPATERPNGMAGHLAGLLAGLERHDVHVKNIETHRPNLEALFLELTGRHLRDD